MLATEHVSVASSTEGTRQKYELLALSLRRVANGVKVHAQAHESLEAMFRDAAPAQYGTPQVEDIGAWSLPIYWFKPDDPLRTGFSASVGNGDRLRAMFRGDSNFYRSLGQPLDTASYPLNLAWLRAVGLSKPEGVTFIVPTVLGPDEAAEWAAAVTKIVDRLWRERLQPYHVHVRVTVDTSLEL